MTKYTALFFCVLVLVLCSRESGPNERDIDLEKGIEIAQKAPDLKKEKENLMETDRLFSKSSEDKGFGEAFALFTAEEARVFQNKIMPIIGKDTIVKFMKENVKGTITWEPYYVEMSSSGDLGYTLGKYQSVVTSAYGRKGITQGHYVTIWKKQPDGTWKLVFDSGIETPK
ncbi:MAG: DUF4440 domain-containing protein [Candidatus Aminicenantes bacterium]|jgi:ketosteroid isomerase-like protein